MTQPNSPSADSDRAVAAPVSEDAAAFEALFRAHYARLCAAVYHILGSRADAEEVVQEVLRRVWQHRARVELQGTLDHYCYRAVRNEAINRLRRRQRETAWHRKAALGAGDGVLASLPALACPADQRVEDEEMLAAVARAVEALPERCRLVFELKWRQGLRYAEIAHALGIAEKTVENHLLKAIKAIRLALGEPLDR